MKSYQLLNQPTQPPLSNAVVEACKQLIALGFAAVPVYSGNSQFIKVITQYKHEQLRFEYAGQGAVNNHSYKSFNAIFNGIKVVWNKPAIKSRGWL